MSYPEPIDYNVLFAEQEKQRTTRTCKPCGFSTDDPRAWFDHLMTCEAGKKAVEKLRAWHRENSGGMRD